MPEPVRKRSERLLFWGSALLALLVLLAHASTYWYEEVVGRSQAPNLPQVSGGVGGLVSVAWVDEGEVASDSVFRLWVLVENRTSAGVKDLKFVAFHTPGFLKIRNCWSNGAPTCRPGSAKGQPPQGLPPTLRPGESAVVYAELSPKSWYGYHGASGVVAWRDDQGKSWERAVVLPAVSISSVRGRILASLGKSLDLLKDLALPLALLILARYLQQRDKALDEIQADRDKKQALLRETWTLMLPKLHGYAEKHYMPVFSSIEAVRQELGSTEDLDGADRRALFELLRLLRRMSHLIHEVGGFYFRDQEGEALAGRSWDLFLSRARKALKRESLDRAMTVVAPDENYAVFLDKLEGRGPGGRWQGWETSDLLRRIEKSFLDWRKAPQFSQDMALLELYGWILLYESNRPYEIWYERPADFPTDGFQTALDKLSTSPENAQVKDLRERIEKYRERSGSPKLEEEWG